jgi:hypothetical protein
MATHKEPEIVVRVRELYCMGKSLAQISRAVGAHIDTVSGRHELLHDEIMAGKIIVNGIAVGGTK